MGRFYFEKFSESIRANSTATDATSEKSGMQFELIRNYPQHFSRSLINAKFAKGKSEVERYNGENIKDKHAKVQGKELFAKRAVCYANKA